MAIKLALFDCDGTLADSQHDISSAIRIAFTGAGLTPPDHAAVRSIIGLSVDRAILVLAPDLPDAAREELGDAYRDAYMTARTTQGSAPEPLYDGIVPTLDALTGQGWALGVATGKSQRGLVRLLTAHGLLDRFVTLQTADLHPSKPDPSMVRAAMAEAGASPTSTIVIGDTSYDMQMALSAGAGALGVDWGYHPRDQLERSGAQRIVEAPADIPAALTMMLEGDRV